MWTVWSCDTVTGVKQGQIPIPASFPWARVLNGMGSGSTVIQLADSEVKKVNIRALTEPVARTLVLEWDGIPVYEGTIWRRKYSRNTRTLTIQHADVWSIIEKRFAVSHYEAAVELWKATYSGISLRQFIKYLMVLGLYGHDNSNMMLPITLPADETGAHTRTVYGYHLANLADSIEDVINEKNGPDVDFRPRWLNDKLDIEMRIGSTTSPMLTAGSYEWNLNAEKSGMFDLEVDETAEKLVTNMVAVGEGSEEDMLVRSNRIVNPTYPHLERALSHKTVSDADALYNLADGGLQTFRNPTTEWGFNVVASGTPKVSSLLLGGTARVYVGEDDWIRPEHTWHDHRLVKFSGDLTEKVQLALQPHGGV